MRLAFNFAYIYKNQMEFYVGIFLGISALCRHFGLRIGIISALKSALSALKIGTQSTPQVTTGRDPTGRSSGLYSECHYRYKDPTYILLVDLLVLREWNGTLITQTG